MVSLQQLLNFSGDTLGDTAGVWQNVADSLAEHTTALQNQVREQLDNGVWSGDAGDAARDHLDRLNAQHTQHEQTLRTIAGTLHAANTGITTAQSALNQALSVAEQAGLEVGTDGSVSWNLPQTINLLTNPGELATIAGLAGQVADLVGKSLDHASTVDNHTADTLGKLDPAGRVTPMMVVPGEGGGVSAGAAAGKQAADLTKQDPVPWQEIQKLLDAHANDRDFATAFYQELGSPQNALELVDEMCVLSATTPGEQAVFADLQKKMGDLLALATDTSKEPNLGLDWINQLELAGTQKISWNKLGAGDHPYGYQLLGALLRNGNYSADFLNTIGNGMIAFENGDSSVWSANMNPQIQPNLTGGGDAGFDPMTGLMTAMSHNKQAAEEFLAPNVQSSEGQFTNNNLEYLLGKRNWFDDQRIGEADPAHFQSPGLTALGSTLQNATTGGVHSSLDASIVSKTVAVLGQDKNGVVPPNMRQSMANMLGAYIGDVHFALTPGVSTDPAMLNQGWVNRPDPALPGSPDEHAVFDAGQLEKVLSSTANDPNAYATLHDAETVYAGLKMHADATTPNTDAADRLSSIRSDGSTAGAVLGQIDQHYIAAMNSKDSAAAAQWNQVLDNRKAVANWLVDNSIGKIPTVGDIASKGIEAAINSVTEGAKVDVSAANQARLATEYANGIGKMNGADLAMKAIWDNQVWDPSQAPPKTEDFKDLYDNGKLRPLDQIQQDPTALNELNQWLYGYGGQGTVGATLHQVDDSYHVGWNTPSDTPTS